MFPVVIQSMLIFKQPEIGAPVLTHCDSTFLYTSPPSACGLWFAMEKCTTTNGCLSFLPGSHKVNSIAERLVRVPGGGTKIVAREGSDAVVEGKTRDWDAEQGWKIEECEIGDVVLIHGSVIHRSEANKSDRSRFIYTVRSHPFSSGLTFFSFLPFLFAGFVRCNADAVKLLHANIVSYDRR